ncbi:C-type mannose receptor 2-like [Mytilus trossulus]|uniref:C-type mannose receptor 2-like n=1 Tax=Mytilus trossulus TaxID=6551 RepID=UPI00300537ED
MGAELVTIYSEDENNYIIERAKIMNSDFWLGANDRVLEGTFVWGDSSDPVIIHNWRYLEPNGGTEENCVYITKTYNFYWGDLRCSTSLPYICEHALSDCPLGWVIPENMTSSSCYLFSTDSKNWESAQIECHNNGADLVAINSMEEMLYIKEQAKDRNSHFWLGANDRLNEGIFVWGDHNETLSVADWLVFLPNGGTNENCIYISKTFRFNWFDITCSNSNPFICKQGLK